MEEEGGGLEGKKGRRTHGYLPPGAKQKSDEPCSCNKEEKRLGEPGTPVQPIVQTHDLHRLLVLRPRNQTNA